MKIIGKTWTILIFPKVSGLIYDYNDKLEPWASKTTWNLSDRSKL